MMIARTTAFSHCPLSAFFVVQCEVLQRRHCGGSTIVQSCNQQQNYHGSFIMQ
jgi:hypothetical protein